MTWPTLRDQLASDIRESQGWSEEPVKFGQPLKPILGRSHAVVRTALDRENAGRQVRENWTFAIELRFLATEMTGEPEAFLLEKADALIMLLAPYSEDPEELITQEPYAGIGSLRRVASVSVSEAEDASPFRGVLIDFTCQTKVWQ